MSHQHRFIFLKTRKTAGTSLEIALSTVCGPDDVIAPIMDADERLRSQAGGRGPQNHTAPPLRFEARPHLPARRVRRLVGKRAWERYFTFAVERNPWDAVVSLYFWHFHDPATRPAFEEFVALPRVANQAVRNAAVYRIDGEVAVDRVLRYEELDAELRAVWGRLGLPGEPALPRAKSGTRPAGSYRDLYTPASRDRVGEVFADVVELLGYEF